MVPRLKRSPGGGHGNPLQYSCLKNPMDRGVWWATVHGVTKSQTGLKRLSTHTHTHTHTHSDQDSGWFLSRAVDVSWVDAQDTFSVCCLVPPRPTGAPWALSSGEIPDALAVPRFSRPTRSQHVLTAWRGCSHSPVSVSCINHHP